MTNETNNRHYSVIDPYSRSLTIEMDGKPIAKTSSALILKEVGKTVYDPVFYVPKEDVLIDIEPEAERQSHCPIKGEASYWNIAGNPTSDYFAWSYENPLPRSRKIEGYIAFNTAYVTFVSAPLSQ